MLNVFLASSQAFKALNDFFWLKVIIQGTLCKMVEDISPFQPLPETLQWLPGNKIDFSTAASASVSSPDVCWS